MSTSTRRSSVLARAVLFGFALSATPVSAQTEVALSGLVADEQTGRLISSARVTLVGKKMETRTDEEGGFVFPTAPTGVLRVRVDATGYPSTVDEARVVPGEAVFLYILVPRVQAVLDEIVVSVSPTRRPTTTDAARTAADLLAEQIPGAYRAGGGPRKIDGPIRLRGNNSIVLSSEPIVLLDGLRMPGKLSEVMDDLSRIPARDVSRIRILRGPSAAFIEGAASGAILIETRAGTVETR